MDEFYCGKCGKWKPASQKTITKTATRPHCLSCQAQYEKRMKTTEKSRDAKRRRDGEAYKTGKAMCIVPNARVERPCAASGARSARTTGCAAGAQEEK